MNDLIAEISAIDFRAKNSVRVATINSLTRIIKTIDLGKFPIEMSFRIQDSICGNILNIVIRGPNSVPPHESTSVTHSRIVPSFGEFGIKSEQVIEWLHSQIKEVVLHELDEFLFIGGKQVRDPHARSAE